MKENILQAFAGEKDIEVFIGNGICYFLRKSTTLYSANFFLLLKNNN